MLQGEDLSLTDQGGKTTVHAVHHVSITIEDRRFIGILGPSGSGKTSPPHLSCEVRRASWSETPTVPENVMVPAPVGP